MNLRTSIDTRTARRRCRIGGFAVAFAAMSLLACSAPEPRITSVSVVRVVEQTAQSITLSTVGCEPTFDLDRGRIESDPTAMLRIGRDAELSAMRTGAEAFTTSMTNMIPPGSYPIELVLTDGRRARFDGQFEITPVDPTITAVRSPRSAIGFGETAIPFSVTVANPSLCAVDALTLLPSFSQNSVSMPLEYQGVAPVHLDPTSTGTFDFSVNLGTGVTADPIEVQVTGTGATRSGPGGCTGSINPFASAVFGVWTVVPANRQSIDVTMLQAMPRSVRAGDTFTLDVTVQNNAGVDLTIESVDVISQPPGITVVDSSTSLAIRLPIGANAVPMIAMQTPNVSESETFVLTAIVNARADDGSLYTSPASGSVTTTVMVRPN